jgi:hypothetical protein
MSSKKKEVFFGDTLNTLGHEDQQFQWSEAYKYYKFLPLAEKKTDLIWTLEIALAGCVPKVTDKKNIFQWCADTFVYE